MLLGLMCLAALLPTACNQARLAGGSPKTTETAGDPNTVELLFTYGSEKEEWIKDVTTAYNASGPTSANGKRIKVKAVPMGSGECVDELNAGKGQGSKAHLTSPASGAFIVLGNAEAKKKTGKELVGPTRNLVVSPVVIAMWKPMAEALGWGQKAIGWADILQISRNPEGWASASKPQWGKFKFGHTQPEYSNSGLISVLAELYAAAGKTDELTLHDLAKPETATFLHEVEKSIVHYGSSTGFFGKKMFENGPQYLSAAVLYENMVIESYSPKYKDLPFPVVAVYPKEGTFWSDHPVGIVQRDWVTDEHKQAARQYIDYLLKPEQQRKAMTYGFRPGLESIPLVAPLDKEHGVDPKEPKTTLAVPSAEVMEGSLKLWHRQKKHAQVVLVFDTSGSMRVDNKMKNAQLGAKQLLSMLGDEDIISLLPFSDKPGWAEKGISLAKGRENAVKVVDSLFPSGETALYDATLMAFQYLQDNPQPDLIQVVVVLTDGEDNKSKLQLNELLNKIKIDYEKKNIRVFTIAYGTDANESVLKKIADTTQAKSYKGTPANIRAVFKDIATFF
jgi:Ca-activated chloride channel family protein